MSKIKHRDNNRLLVDDVCLVIQETFDLYVQAKNTLRVAQEKTRLIRRSLGLRNIFDAVMLEDAADDIINSEQMLSDIEARSFKLTEYIDALEQAQKMRPTPPDVDNDTKYN